MAMQKQGQPNSEGRPVHVLFKAQREGLNVDGVIAAEMDMVAVVVMAEIAVVTVRVAVFGAREPVLNFGGLVAGSDMPLVKSASASNAVEFTSKIRAVGFRRVRARLSFSASCESIISVLVITRRSATAAWRSDSLSVPSWPAPGSVPG